MDPAGVLVGAPVDVPEQHQSAIHVVRVPDQLDQVVLDPVAVAVGEQDGPAFELDLLLGHHVQGQVVVAEHLHDGYGLHEGELLPVLEAVAQVDDQVAPLGEPGDRFQVRAAVGVADDQQTLHASASSKRRTARARCEWVFFSSALNSA
ncbi:hypothetical protein D3C86_1392290 [compost metagenome]